MTKLPSPPMPLLRELGIVLVLKCCALLVLWWLFARDATVPVDAARAAAILDVPVSHSRSRP